MKFFIGAVLAFCLGAGVTVNAAETESAELAAKTPTCTLSPEAENALTDELRAMSSSEYADTEVRSHDFHGYWHCTAYPNHGGHGHGHDAVSYDYSQAYYQALYSCQQYHGYCHVHCHMDHH